MHNVRRKTKGRKRSSVTLSLNPRFYPPTSLLAGDVDVCRLPPSPGGDCSYYPAEAREVTQQRYFYDLRSKRCRPFTYKGCSDYNPNFPTRAACEARCVRQGWSHSFVAAISILYFYLKNFFTTVLARWVFSHGKFRLPSPWKASCDRGALPNPQCILGVLLFP